MNDAAGNANPADELPVEWHRLRASQIQALAQPDSIVIVPIASVEHHGPHFPTGVDTFLGTKIARRAVLLARPHRTVLVTPTIWHGLAEMHMSLGGTLTLDLDAFIGVVRSCSIPDDHIDPRRSAFFMARSIPEGHSKRGSGMLIQLHSQTTTTPKVRAAIQASAEPASALAERFGTTEQTVYKWKHRDSVHDRSHTPHRLQTTLTPAQEAVAVVLRKTLLVSLDDLLAVVREFLNPEVSRSGLDRCLRRHGVGNLRDLQAKAPRPVHKAFKAYEPGYLHIDVKYTPFTSQPENPLG